MMWDRNELYAAFLANDADNVAEEEEEEYKDDEEEEDGEEENWNTLSRDGLRNLEHSIMIIKLYNERGHR